MTKLLQANSEEQVEQARRLFLEYAEGLGFDLCFQNFESELASLPGDYAPPRGRLWLARDDDRWEGCVALRDLGDGVCEMSRLYVRPDSRGNGIGAALANALVEEARRIGYTRMRLHTLPSMKAAVGLYESLGFEDVKPYNGIPIAGAKYFELVLKAKVDRNVSTRV